MRCLSEILKREAVNYDSFFLVYTQKNIHVGWSLLFRPKPAMTKVQQINETTKGFPSILFENANYSMLWGLKYSIIFAVNLKQ